MPVDIRKPLKKYLPHLLKAREDNLNEADTVQRLIKVFEEVFGYDPMGEISREAAIKDRFVDVAIKIDNAVRFLVEAKSAATVLRDRSRSTGSAVSPSAQRQSVARSSLKRPYASSGERSVGARVS